MTRQVAARPEGWLQRLRNRSTTRAALVLLVLLALAAALDTARLWQHERWNALIASAQTAPEAEAAERPELRFAAAYAQAASGAEEVALNRYRALQGPGALGQEARFNSANLMLRQAMKLHASDQRGQALPLVELAKETYREVLRNDPQHWPARYNLERAQRLVPDPEDGDNLLSEPPQQAERSATTMRGYSPGLP